MGLIAAILGPPRSTRGLLADALLVLLPGRASCVNPRVVEWEAYGVGPRRDVRPYTPLVVAVSVTIRTRVPDEVMRASVPCRSARRDAITEVGPRASEVKAEAVALIGIPPTFLPRARQR